MRVAGGRPNRQAGPAAAGARRVGVFGLARRALCAHPRACPGALGARPTAGGACRPGDAWCPPRRGYCAAQWRPLPGGAACAARAALRWARRTLILKNTPPLGGRCKSRFLSPPRNLARWATGDIGAVAAQRRTFAAATQGGARCRVCPRPGRHRTKAKRTPPPSWGRRPRCYNPPVRSSASADGAAAAERSGGMTGGYPVARIHDFQVEDEPGA